MHASAGKTGLRVPSQQVRDWSGRDSGLVEMGVALGFLVREPSRWGFLAQELILMQLEFLESRGPVQTESWTDEGVFAIEILEGVSQALGQL